MIWMRKFIVFLFLVTVTLAGSYAYAGDFNLAECDWTPDRVKLVINNVPPGTRVVICVEQEGSNCDIKAQAWSTPAGPDGIVVVNLTKQNDRAFGVGDLVSISDPDCAALESGGSLVTSSACNECEECNPSLPSLTQYGLIVLAILIALTGLWMYRRKRATA